MSSTNFMYYLDAARNLQVGAYTRIPRGGSGVDIDLVRRKEVGHLKDLVTEDKSNLVAAINEVASAGDE